MTINKSIEYYIKNVYGNENIYIIGENAKHIQTLTNKKTIDKGDMLALEKLGLIFTRTFEPNK
jgi:hypothetical protein